MDSPFGPSTLTLPAMAALGTLSLSAAVGHSSGHLLRALPTLSPNMRLTILTDIQVFNKSQ